MPFFNTHTSKYFLSYNGNELKAFPDCLPQHYLKKWNVENVDIILKFRKIYFILRNPQKVDMILRYTKMRWMNFT